MDPQELQRLLALRESADATVRHYHDKLWQGAQFFLWAFAGVMAASFALLQFGPGEAINMVAANLLVLLAICIVVFGQRVIQQERAFLGFFLEIRKEIDKQLGWEIDNPRIQKLTGIWAGGTIEGGFSYAQATDEASPEFALGDRGKANITEALRDKKGIYGVIQRLFAIAFVVCVLAPFLYMFAWSEAVREKRQDPQACVAEVIETESKELGNRSTVPE